MSEVLYDFGANSVVPASEVKEGGDYTLFEPGEYPFTVIGFQRTRMDKPDTKIPKGAWGAKLSFMLTAPDGSTTTVQKTFWLIQTLSWVTGSLLISVGWRKSGDGIDYNMLEMCKQKAATGRLKLKHRKGTGKHADKSFNEIDKFLPPTDDTTPPDYESGDEQQQEEETDLF